MTKRLYIYYDNPTDASNMYLKYLKLDAEKYGIQTIMMDDLEELSAIFEYGYNEKEDFVLPLYPLSSHEMEKKFIEWLEEYPYADVDNVTDKSAYSHDATAMGIYEYITNKYPYRGENVAVIGRGKVGKELLNLLTHYGYTTFNFNSKSDKDDMLSVLEYADIVVGLSSKDYILNSEECERLGYYVKEFIDGGNNFCTKDKSRCGKWTRDILFSRMN